MDAHDRMRSIATAHAAHFPEGDDPFKIGCRLSEETGEVVRELNHYARRGVSTDKNDAEGKDALVHEAYQVYMVVHQLMAYFDLSDQFRAHIEDKYEEYARAGIIPPAGK